MPIFMNAPVTHERPCRVDRGWHTVTWRDEHDTAVLASPRYSRLRRSTLPLPPFANPGSATECLPRAWRLYAVVSTESHTKLTWLVKAEPQFPEEICFQL